MTRLRSLALFVAPVMLLSVAAATMPVSVAAIHCAPWDDICSQLNGQQQKSSQNKGRLAQIQGQIRDADQRMRALGDLIRTLDAQVATQQATVAATQQRIAALDGQIRATQADLVRREQHLQQREDMLGERVRSMDKHDSVDYMALVLSSASFNELLDRIVMTEEIIRSDHQLVLDLRSEREAVIRVRDQLEQQRSEQAGLLAAQQSEEAQLEQTRTLQQQALAYQQRLAKQLDGQRRELEREQAVINARISALQAAYAAEARAAGGGTGQFVWPEGGDPGISQPFGCTDVLGEPWWPSCPTRHFHMGIDIAGPYGAPVFAADSGVAFVFSEAPYGYGNYVVVTHGNGWATLYGHLAGYAVRSGQVVYRGQTIGYEGSTGYSTGPHLHFGIQYNGAWQNPCVYLGC